MAYQQMVTNDEGEPLGTETLYDDETSYWDGHDFGEEYSDLEEDDEPDTTEDGFPYETDLGGEWS
jgi:hypothetical protein